MINPYALTLAIMALLAVMISWDVPRARLWIATIAWSYIVSSMAWDAIGHDVPRLHAFITMLCDCVVCLTVYHAARERWEIWLYRLFLVSVFSSVIRVAGWIDTNILYASLLEIINALAFIMIAGVGIQDRIARHGPSRAFRHRVRGGGVSRLSLRAPRKAPPWHRA